MRFAFSRTSVAHLAAQLRRDEITFPESAVLDVASTTAGTPGYHPAGGHPLALEWSARRVAQVMGRPTGRAQRAAAGVSGAPRPSGGDDGGSPQADARLPPAGAGTVGRTIGVVDRSGPGQRHHRATTLRQRLAGRPRSADPLWAHPARAKPRHPARVVARAGAPDHPGAARVSLPDGLGPMAGGTHRAAHSTVRPAESRGGGLMTLPRLPFTQARILEIPRSYGGSRRSNALAESARPRGTRPGWSPATRTSKRSSPTTA